MANKTGNLFGLAYNAAANCTAAVETEAVTLNPKQNGATRCVNCTLPQSAVAWKAAGSKTGYPKEKEVKV